MAIIPEIVITLQRRFVVIDKRTGQEANPEAIAIDDEWARDKLIYCDMEGFALMEDGSLILCDELGSFVYCPNELFEVRHFMEVKEAKEER